MPIRFTKRSWTTRWAVRFRVMRSGKKTIPAYMALIKQCDDQMGRLFEFLDETGRMDDTMIVITSDHGDYLGDHWLGEKDLFHEPSVKIPLIIYDPRASADATRGTTCDALVEAIDLVPTFVEAAGGTPANHILEGRSLMPFLHGIHPAPRRDYAISEYDYSATAMCSDLGVEIRDARLFMVTDQCWKFIHAEGGFRPMLFDLGDDPDELNDLARTAGYQDVIALMYDRLSKWARRPAQRVTLSDADIAAIRSRSRRRGILLGLYEPGETDPELSAKYRGPVPRKDDG